MLNMEKRKEPDVPELGWVPENYAIPHYVPCKGKKKKGGGKKK